MRGIIPDPRKPLVGKIGMNDVIISIGISNKLFVLFGLKKLPMPMLLYSCRSSYYTFGFETL